MKKNGSITIIGGGIAAVQAALDIANSDFKVFLIEEKPSIGGVMAQLDKTFPTNDCSSCMMGPKLVELANHKNIEILAYTDVLDITGEPGDFHITVNKKARAVNPDKCVGCGICAEKCPTKVNDEFNIGINKRKAIYVPYPQAVPLIYTIDKDNCRYFTKGKCKVCEKVCENKAIDFDQKDSVETLDTGAVILAGGLEPFDAGKLGSYGYGRWPNCITSLEYERILSASGPYQGHIKRTSDGKNPRNIAWIQCIGSRNSHIGQDYCSSVCCMYATKQAMITQEHASNIETKIFSIDIRAQGKGFDRFYERSITENSVHYIRSMISRIIPNPEDDTLKVFYTTPDHTLKEENFDLIVLSVGLCPNPTITQLAQKIGLDINEHGFVASDPMNTSLTNKNGIFICGVIQGPKDIPDSVQQASCAAAHATAMLADVRGSLIEPTIPQPERDIAGEAPRIGVYICHCGINIAGVVDVKEVAKYAKSLPNVEYSTDCMFACSTDQQENIKKAIQTYNLNRLLVASCTPRTHEPLFRNTIQEAGLNPYLFELANIREQDAWVHQSEPEAATAKAKDLVRMSVSRVRLLQPLYDTSIKVQQSALVIGGGLAGLTAAEAFADQGYPVELLEKTAQMGGNALTLYYTEDGANPADYVRNLIKRVENNPLVTTRTNADLLSISGSCGNFAVTVNTNGTSHTLKHGVIIVATGAEEYKPKEYLYGKHQKVVTQKEFESMLVNHPEEVKKLKQIVMIQCVGSREPDHLYCSKVCCTAAIKNSLKCKSLHANAEIAILYRDIRTYGLKESYYTQARRQGIRFFRYERDQKPEIQPDEKGINISVLDQQLQSTISLQADLLVLSAAVRPNEESKHLSEVTRLPLDEDGFFMEAHVKLRPLDFASAGYYLCGIAHGPKFSSESITQARGAVSRAITVLSHQEIKADAVINHVDPTFCRGCGECEKVCSFDAIKVEEHDGCLQAEVAEALCTGCGACNVACPTGAASLSHFQDEQIEAMIETAT